MNYLKIIEKMIASKSKVKILNFLANNKGVYSANYICKYAEISPRSSLLSLRDLVEIGIVNYKESEGYSLNYENHFVYKMIHDIFSSNRKYVFSKFKTTIIEFLDNYSENIYSILVNNNEEVLIILNLAVTDEAFDELVKKEIPRLKDKLLNTTCFNPKIMAFKKNYIPYDIFDSWLKVRPIYGKSLKTIEMIDNVTPEEIKKALEFFQINDTTI